MVPGTAATTMQVTSEAPQQREQQQQLGAYKCMLSRFRSSGDDWLCCPPSPRRPRPVEPPPSSATPRLLFPPARQSLTPPSPPTACHCKEFHCQYTHTGGVFLLSPACRLGIRDEIRCRGSGPPKDPTKRGRRK